jgi:Patatin-like phospholipase
MSATSDFGSFVRSRSNTSAALLLVVAIVALQACSSPTRLGAEPPEFAAQAIVLDTPNARFYPDVQVAELVDEGLLSLQREMAALGVTDPNELPPANYLAISGGGPDGAFGAGLLVGWTEAGTRPQFKLVTGISTGALIAPFAFLGPAYDEQLKDVYTTIQDSDVFADRGYIDAVFFNDALKDTSPLYGLIEGYVNEDMLTEIAGEYMKGRLLLIGTTNLDARRPVFWNIGAIAASGQPGALELIHKILLASAAMPMAFPPVMIDVEKDGQHYQEMHVDGGAIAQLFLYPPSVGAEFDAYREENGMTRERHAFVIRNGSLSVGWSTVDRSTLSIGGQAISTMIMMSGINDLYRVYFTTQIDGVDYNLAYIQDDFEAPTTTSAEMFDPAYMNALFDYGYDKGRAGYAWMKTPPFFTAQ